MSSDTPEPRPLDVEAARTTTREGLAITQRPRRNRKAAWSRRLMREHPDISAKLVIALGRRLREANERLARQSFQTVQSRVAVVLTDLVEQALAENPGGQGEVLLTITQADVAQLAGSSRESASRFLATLERAGVVKQGRGRITVRDPG